MKSLEPNGRTQEAKRGAFMLRNALNVHSFFGPYAGKLCYSVTVRSISEAIKSQLACDFIYFGQGGTVTLFLDIKLGNV